MPVHDYYFRVLQSSVLAERVVNIVQIDRNVLHVSATQKKTHKHFNVKQWITVRTPKVWRQKIVTPRAHCSPSKYSLFILSFFWRPVIETFDFLKLSNLHSYAYSSHGECSHQFQFLRFLFSTKKPLRNRRTNGQIDCYMQWRTGPTGPPAIGRWAPLSATCGAPLSLVITWI